MNYYISESHQQIQDQGPCELIHSPRNPTIYLQRRIRLIPPIFAKKMNESRHDAEVEDRLVTSEVEDQVS